MSQFVREDFRGDVDFVSDGNITLEADRDQDGLGSLVFRTGGLERGRFTNAGTLQVGPALNLSAFSVGAIINSGVTFSYTGTTGYESGVNAEGTVVGTSPLGPTAALAGFQSYLKDASSVVNKAVSGAANNGSGLVRLTVIGHGLSTGARVGVYNVGGTTEANGSWAVTVIDANTVDLQGSAFSHAYTSGGTLTNRGAYYGAVLNVAPSLDRGGLTGTAQNGDDVVGVAISNRGTGKATDGIYIGRNSTNFPSSSEWLTGLAVAANTDTAVYLASSCNYGVDFKDGTYANGALRLPNNVQVVARDAANASDVELFRYDSSNRFQVTPNIRGLGQLVAHVADAAKVSIGDVGGTTAGIIFGASSQANLYLATNYLLTDNLFRAALAVSTKVKAGTPADGDWSFTPPDGTIVGDSTGAKIWIRLGGTWKGVAVA